MHTVQQALEATVRTQVVEPWIQFYVRNPRRALLIGHFQPSESLLGFVKGRTNLSQKTTIYIALFGRLLQLIENPNCLLALPGCRICVSKVGDEEQIVAR